MTALARVGGSRRWSSAIRRAATRRRIKCNFGAPSGRLCIALLKMKFAEKFACRRLADRLQGAFRVTEPRPGIAQANAVN